MDKKESAFYVIRRRITEKKKRTAPGIEAASGEAKKAERTADPGFICGRDPVSGRGDRPAGKSYPGGQSCLGGTGTEDCGESAGLCGGSVGDQRIFQTGDHPG